MTREAHRRLLRRCMWVTAGFTFLTMFDIFAPWSFSGFAISAVITLLLDTART